MEYLKVKEEILIKESRARISLKKTSPTTQVNGVQGLSLKKEKRIHNYHCFRNAT